MSAETSETGGQAAGLTEPLLDQPEVTDPLPSLAVAIDDCILALPQLAKWLRDDHPPFHKSLTDAIRHYGGPCAPLDLWCGCRALYRLRLVVLAEEAAARKPRKPVHG